MNQTTASLEDILAAAVEITSADERQAYIVEACAGEPSLRQQVERMVDNYFRGGDFLERSPIVPPTADDSELIGTFVGPYKLLEQIGEGGMGLVFMAEQTEPVRRKVALKIVKPGMDTRQVIARFEAERQALALMDHPNIAKILDAGVVGRAVSSGQWAVGSKDNSSLPTADCSLPTDLPTAHCSLPTAGRPYFVMELVRGVPITDFCDQHRLDTRRRLALFVQVCRAVQHAHQKGVIHRDLKPGNVLVTLHDTVPVPKVIDFGIAKATSGQRLTERTLFTHFVQMVGTPLYMSPEQAEMNGLDVDTRSDVYSLGVLLYELLTGTTPFDSETLKQVGFDEMRRLIREEEPPSPSRRLSTLALERQSTVSERRGVDGRRLGQTLRGELDWIVTKALEKDRNRRYESASALAADVERYLADEPVEAGPPSAVYRMRKYVRRNRRLLAVAGLFVVTLVAATAVSTWQAVKAREAERRAATEAAIARAVSDFLQSDLIGQATSVPELDQELGGNRDLTVREALDRAASRIGQRFEAQPLVEAAIRMTIGATYLSLDEPQLAVPHLERAVELRQTHLGMSHPDTLSSVYKLAVACESSGRLPEAISLHQQLLENRIEALGPSHPVTLVSGHYLAIAQRKAGHFDTSIRLLEDALEKQRIVRGPTHPDTVATTHTLAITLALNNGDRSRLAESIALHEQVVEILQSTLGHNHDGVLWPMQCWGDACQRAGKFDQADQLFRKVLEQRRKRTDSFGRILMARTLQRFGENLVLQQRYDEAEHPIQEALDIFDRQRPDDWQRFDMMSVLGDVLIGRQKYAEAERHLLQGYEGMKLREAKITMPQRYRLAVTGERIVRLYQATGQPEKVREWRAKLMAERSEDRR